MYTKYFVTILLSSMIANFSHSMDNQDGPNFSQNSSISSNHHQAQNDNTSEVLKLKKLLQNYYINMPMPKKEDKRINLIVKKSNEDKK